MYKTIQCTINGLKLSLDVDIRASLLDILRTEGYTGTKQGCGVGECGACTVLIDNVPIDSCLYLAVRADGKEIRTIEGEAALYAKRHAAHGAGHKSNGCTNGQGTTLSPMQKALVDAGAVQCGFCTPGMVMAATALVEECCQTGQSTSLDRDTIRHGMSGNLCRCTGYDAIVNAIESCVEETLLNKHKKG